MASTLLSLVLLAIVFLPASGHLRAEYFVVVLALGAFGISRFRRARAVGPEIVIYFLMAVFGLVSVTVYSAEQGTFVWRDLLGVLRFVIYGMFIAAGAVLAPRSAREMNRLGTTLTVMGFLAAALTFLQYFDVGGINVPIASLYSEAGLERGRYDELLSGTYIRRATGTFGNPNWWSWLLVCLTLFLGIRTVEERRPLLAVVLGLLIASILLTGSRTALAALFAGVVVAGTAAVFAGRFTIRGAVAAILLSMFLAGAGAMAFSQVFEGRDRFTSEFGSFRARVVLWQARFEQVAERPLLGTGPRKARLLSASSNLSERRFTDNTYLAVLTHFGLLGFMTFLALLATQWTRLTRLTRRMGNTPGAWVVTGTLCAFVANLVYGITADSLFFVQTSLLIGAIYGATVPYATEALAASPLTEPVRDRRG